MSAAETATVTVRVPKPVADRLQRLARELRRSRSSVAAEAIELFLEAVEKENQPLIEASDLSVDLPPTDRATS